MKVVSHGFHDQTDHRVGNGIHKKHRVHAERQNWDGKFRKIQIVAQEQGYKVYARKGYYAHPKYQAMR